MVTEQQRCDAEQMRREVKGLCYKCGEPLPANVLQLQGLSGYPREEFGLCHDCWGVWKFE